MNSTYSNDTHFRRVRLGVNDHGMIRLQIRLREAPPAPEPQAPWHRRFRHHAGRWLEALWGE
jgi:hypothetical protein